MAIAAAFILYVLAGNAAPTLTPLAAYASMEACTAAAKEVKAALAKGEEGATVACLSTDALETLGKTAEPPAN